MLISTLFRRVVHEGSLTVVGHDGKTETFGQGEPKVTVRIADRSTEFRIVTNPKLAMGEAYMDGTLEIEDGTLYDFLDLCARNATKLENHPVWGLYEPIGRLLRPLRTYNPASRARRNVAHHYDLSNELYDLFLDDDRQYSCAYFMSSDDTLEEAQTNKKRHLASKLLLDEPGLRVLDIGSGWGGLGLYLAENSGAHVTGITLSTEQQKASTQRARRVGLDGQVDFRLEDYRDLEGRFDRIVSVGMFEHVGVRYYRAFFRKIHDLLNENGVGLVHSIGRMSPPAGTNAWMQKYIFPGGYAPALSEVLAAVEREGLWVTDIEILRLHYAKTLRCWRERFARNRDKVKALYDERFCRMWEFYLTACEIWFRQADQMVFQLQVARRKDAVPLTRDYMLDWERAQIAESRRAAAAE